MPKVFLKPPKTRKITFANLNSMLSIHCGAKTGDTPELMPWVCRRLRGGRFLANQSTLPGRPKLCTRTLNLDFYLGLICTCGCGIKILNLDLFRGSKFLLGRRSILQHHVFVNSGLKHFIHCPSVYILDCSSYGN